MESIVPAIVLSDLLEKCVVVVSYCSGDINDLFNVVTTHL